MEKYIITYFKGGESEINKNCKIIKASDEKEINKILNLERVRRLNNDSGEKYGTGIKFVINPETKEYELWRDNVCIVNECDRIIPLYKNFRTDYRTRNGYQTGLIYCEKSFNGKKFFIEYSIDYTKNKHFVYNYTDYCLFNKETKSLVGIKGVKIINSNKISNALETKKNIRSYVLAKQDYFDQNSILKELISNNIMQFNDYNLLSDVLTKLYEENMISIHTDENKNIYYSVNKVLEKKKTR